MSESIYTIIKEFDRAITYCYSYGQIGLKGEASSLNKKALKKSIFWAKEIISSGKRMENYLITLKKETDFAVSALASILEDDDGAS